MSDIELTDYERRMLIREIARQAAEKIAQFVIADIRAGVLVSSGMVPFARAVADAVAAKMPGGAQ